MITNCFLLCGKVGLRQCALLLIGSNAGLATTGPSVRDEIGEGGVVRQRQALVGFPCDEDSGGRRARPPQG